MLKAGMRSVKAADIEQQNIEAASCLNSGSSKVQPQLRPVKRADTRLGEAQRFDWSNALKNSDGCMSSALTTLSMLTIAMLRSPLSTPPI